MKRDTGLLAEEEFDVLVIGSGIYGAFLTREASMRGLRVAMIEQGDFGAATSANSLKVVHGGLRYLQHLNWVRMRESIRARRQLLTIAPYLVHPYRFLVPTFGYGMQSKWLMRAALLLNDIVSIDRNRGVDAGNKIPSGKLISRKQCHRFLPDTGRDKLTGAAQWYDGFIENTERLMLAIVHSAAKQGAVVANYVKADSYLMTGKRVAGVNAVDMLNDQPISIKARMVINAAGPGASFLDTSLTGQASEAVQSWVKAFNIFIKKPLFNGVAVGLSSTTEHIDKDAVINKGKRLYFFVPWKGGTLIGTDYTAAVPGDDSTGLTGHELNSIVDEINALYPAAKIQRDDIGFCHVGLLPANNSDPAADAASHLLKHTRVTDHEATSGTPGLFTVTGIKYTVASQVVIDVIDKVLVRMNTQAPRPDVEPCLYGAELDLTVSLQPGNSRLFNRYGSRFDDVIGISDRTPNLRDAIGTETETIGAEVIHAVREEMAFTLSDVVYRRTDLGCTGIPSDDTLNSCAEIMAAELGWDQTRMEQEIISVRDGAQYCRR
jgi:glycerol-3-phosphate dehydrogenase